MTVGLGLNDRALLHVQNRYKFNPQMRSPPTNVPQQGGMAAVANPNMVVPGQQKLSASLLAGSSVHEQKQVSVVCGCGPGSLRLAP